MEVHFTLHAMRRAFERGITTEAVETVLENPDEVINVRFGRKAAFKRFGNDHIVVIFEVQKDKITVVTTLKVDRERLKRYGFSRI